MQYIWDENAVITGNFPYTTGCYRALNTTDFAATINISGSGFQFPERRTRPIRLRVWEIETRTNI